MTIEANIEGRAWTMQQQPTSEIVRADLKSRGFDGEIFIGESRPIGRQRATKHSMFYRSNDGRFVAIIIN